jgi:CubicO group peptidase (beta-lactamase class C family)
MNRQILIYLLILSSVCSSGIQQKETTFIDYSKKVQTWLTTYKVPAVGIGVIDEGKLRQIMVFGDLKKNEPAPYNTIFQVASLTKPVTAILTLKLVSMGQWQLDEPLSNYWVDPDVANDPRHLKLTTRHVLTHQTGFDNWRWLSTSRKLTFNFDPGTNYRYSGEGFEYLRRSLEHKFKKPMDRLADSLLFRPLNMNDTRLVWDDNVDTSRFAVPHDTLQNILNRSLNISMNKKANAADLLKTTVEDYCKFCLAVMNKSWLTKNVFNEMVRPQVERPKYSYGLGWAILKGLSNGEYAILHTGSDEGIQTIVILLPMSGRGMVVFTNGVKGYEVYMKVITESLDLGEEIIKKFFNK